MSRQVFPTALTLALLLFGLLLAYRFLTGIATAVLVLIMGMLMAVVLSGPIEALHRRRVPRAIASASIGLGGFAALALVGYLFLPGLAKQASQLFRALPGVIFQLNERLEQLAGDIGLPATSTEGPSLSTLADWGRQLMGGGLNLFGNMASVLLGLVVVFFVALYLAADPKPAVDWAVKLWPPDYRPRARAILSKVRLSLLSWLKGWLASMAIVGALSMAALYLMGIPAAVFRGLFSGLVEFVPYFGPVVAAVPPLPLALAHDPVDGAWVILAYFVIQQAESNLITPLLIRGTTSLHPAAETIRYFAL